MLAILRSATYAYAIFLIITFTVWSDSSDAGFRALLKVLSIYYKCGKGSNMIDDFDDEMSEDYYN